MFLSVYFERVRLKKTRSAEKNPRVSTGARCYYHAIIREGMCFSRVCTLGQGYCKRSMRLCALGYGYITNKLRVFPSLAPVAAILPVGIAVVPLFYHCSVLTPPGVLWPCGVAALCRPGYVYLPSGRGKGAPGSILTLYKSTYYNISQWHFNDLFYNYILYLFCIILRLFGYFNCFSCLIVIGF